MNIMRMIVGSTVRAVVYRIVALLFVAIAAIYSSDTKAGVGGCNSNNPAAGPVCDQGKAYSICTARLPGYGGFGVGVPAQCLKNVSLDRFHICTMSGNCSQANDDIYWFGSPCSARPAYEGGVNGGILAGAPQCDGGCEMKAQAGRQGRIDTRSTSIFTGSGVYSPTGAVCSNGDQTPERAPPRDEYCTTLEGGAYQMCVDKDFKSCVKSNLTGRKYCGDNDFPTVGVDPQRREAVAISAPTNPPTPAPTPVPREGEAFTPNSSASVTNTTTNNTTNITNFNNSGSPGTTPVPGDGSGNPGEPGEGEGEEEGHGSTSGGGDCATPYVCSGGDPVLCSFGTQAWLQRCAGDENNNNQPDWTEIGEGQGGDGVTPGGEGEAVAKEFGLPGLDKIDDSGFIGSSCPLLPVVDFGEFGSVDLSSKPWWCSTISKIGMLVMFAGACIGLAILVS